MLDKIKKFLTQEQNDKQAIAKNIFWLLATQGSRVFRAILIIYAARVLGASEYGIFSYVLGLAGLMLLFSDLGVGEILTRDIAGKKDRREEYFAASFWIRMVPTLIFGLAVILIAPHISNFRIAASLIFLGIIYTAFDNLRTLFISYLRGLQKMELETLLAGVMNLIFLGLGFLVLIKYPDAKGLLTVYAVSTAAGALVGVFIARKMLRSIFLNFKKGVAKEVLMNCWPVAVFGIFGLMINIDVIMLGWWRTSAEIGLYSAGYKLVNFSYNIPAILAAAFLPALSASVQSKNPEKEKWLNEISLVLSIAFALPVIVGGLLLAEPIVKIILGNEYIDGVNAFRIFLLALAFNFPGTVIFNIVLAHNRQKQILKQGIIAFGLNIGLNALLIPKLGISGAATGTVISQAILNIWIWREMRRINEFKIFNRRILNVLRS
jgi:O-antigen/teichoic acid export membrane protein